MTPKRITTGLILFGLVSLVSLSILLDWGEPGRFASERIEAQTLTGAQFRYISGSFLGDHATYTFQTPPDEKHYAEDCIGCKQEVGNSVIFAEFGCPKKSKYLLEANSENISEVVERISILDKDGSVIGERRLVAFKDKGEVKAARLFWVEGQDFWAVQAPTIALTKALMESDEYKNVRQKVAEEIKSYVPIQNANTIVKKPC